MLQETFSSGPLAASEFAGFGPAGYAFSIPAALLLLILPRRYAFVPLVLTACWMTFGQQITIGPFHFTVWRLMLLAGWCRILMRWEFKGFVWVRQDTLLCLWSTTSILAYTILFHSADAFVNRLGVIYNSAGAYFLLRCLITEVSDVKRVVKLCAVALAPVALCMAYEYRTGWNVFSILGGVPAMAEVRDGIVRAQGPLRHPILAGTFGATWIPLFAGLWWQGRGNRLAAVIGLAAASSMVFLSASSGPILTVVIGLLSLLFWNWAQWTRALRWGIVLTLAALQSVMNSPVWFIFAKINIFSGSTGWHRANLIDLTFRHFFEWWLIGTPDERVAAWGVFYGDITNQYIVEAIFGGLTTMVLFIWIIVLAFKTIGKALSWSRQNGDKRVSLLIWASGAAMVSHVAAFFSISYFDQNLFNYYMLLAVVAMYGIIGQQGAVDSRKDQTAGAGAVSRAEIWWHGQAPDYEESSGRWWTSERGAGQPGSDAGLSSDLLTDMDSSPLLNDEPIKSNQ